MPGLTVCLRCGSPRIHPQTMGEGLIPGGGEGLAWSCDDCGFLGAPFESGEDTYKIRTPVEEPEGAALARRVDRLGRVAGVAALLIGTVLLVGGVYAPLVAFREGSGVFFVAGGIAGILVGAGFALAGLRLLRHADT
ncbi:MAG: hypothetical protein ACT4PT_08390 [Methanobacteriota archaeon]